MTHMVWFDKRRGRMALSALVAIVVAAILLAITTGLRLALTPYLGGLSPFMLYVAAVLAAGLISGPFCGVLVMLVGGFLGYQLFLSPDGVAQQGSILALMLFWGVSAPVLATASELRSQLRDAMGRLSAAIDRKGQDRIRS
jgi:K+-sensing histidine kinase KdpD